MRPDEREFSSFSETDRNGQFQEAYGYFVKTKEGASSQGWMEHSGACTPDAHDFEMTEAITGGMRYRCRRCGMEALADSLSGSFEKQYFGSFIADVSYRWHPESMDVTEMTGFTVLYGESPRIKVTFDGSFLIVENQSANNSYRWNGFFNSRHIPLTCDSCSALWDVLAQINFAQWETPREVFDRLLSPGFRIEQAFFCTFRNGRQYKSLRPEWMGFQRLTQVIESLCGVERQVFSAPAAKTVMGKRTLCCGAEVPMNYAFCPKCGRVVEGMAFPVEISCDPDATSWLCENCGEGIAMEYTYCGRCGQKRRW